MRVCSKCQAGKSAKEFRVLKRGGKPYVMPSCRECERAARREYKQRPEVKATEIARRQTPEAKAKQRDYMREYFRKQRELANIAKQAIAEGRL